MSRKQAKFKRQITALRDDEFSALEDAAETDMRLEADQARYLIVEGLKRRNLLSNHQDAEDDQED